MDVQIERSPEPLDHGHRATTTVLDAALARASAQEAEHGSGEQANDPAAHVVIPGQLAPQAVGQTQDPLSHGHVREYVINQVGGALGHPAAAATRTDREALARKGNQPVEGAIAAAKPRESKILAVPGHESLLFEGFEGRPDRPDSEQLERATNHGLVILTHDLAFSRSATTARHLLKPMSLQMKQVFVGSALEAVLAAAAEQPPSNEDLPPPPVPSSLYGLRRSFVTVLTAWFAQ